MIAILVIPSADSSGRQLASFCRELSQPARGSVDTEYFQVDTDTDMNTSRYSTYTLKSTTRVDLDIDKDKNIEYFNSR